MLILKRPGISKAARGIPTRPSSPPVISRHFHASEKIIMPKLRISQEYLGAAVRSHRIKAGLPEGEQSRVPEQEIEPEREDGKEQDVDDDVNGIFPGVSRKQG